MDDMLFGYSAMNTPMIFFLEFVVVLVSRVGARGSVVVKALCYKPEGHGFETR
jgi:hypothetical protein